jgi:hypothetical protein
MSARQWRLRRQPQPRPDGQQRWDRAYQHLLRWTSQASIPVTLPNPQEDYHACRHLRTGFDPAPGSSSDH